MAAGGDDFELDHAAGEAVVALFGDQAEEIALLRRFVGVAMCQPAKLLEPA